MIAAPLALSLALVASNARPVAPAQPSAVFYAPHARALGDLRAFLTAASAYAPSLDPAPWGRQLGAPLSLDLFDLSAWPSAGLDPDGPVTLVLQGDDALLTLPIKRPKVAVARARAALAARGTVSTQRLKGTEVDSVRREPGAIEGAYAVRGARLLALLPSQSLALLKSALEAAPRLDRARGLRGSLYLFSSLGAGSSLALGLIPSARALALDGRLLAPEPLAVHPRNDPYAHLTPRGLLAAHVALSPRALAQLRPDAAATLRLLLAQVCRDCGEGPAQSLLEQLAGPVAMVATSIQPERARGDRDIDRYFLLAHAYAAQVRDPARAKEALHQLVAELTAHGGAPTSPPLALAGEHHLLRIDAHRVLAFGLAGDSLYLANDEAARDALLGALAQGAGQAAGVGAIRIDGAAGARALGGITILDLSRSHAVAALFAAAVEVGPLLKATGTTEILVEPDPRGARFGGTVNIPAPSHAATSGGG